MHGVQKQSRAEPDAEGSALLSLGCSLSSAEVSTSRSALLNLQPSERPGCVQEQHAGKALVSQKALYPMCLADTGICAGQVVVQR